MNKNLFSILTAAATVAFAAMNASATMVVGDENTTTVVTPTHTIITATQDATLTVTDPGEIEILLVGGGGGAGGANTSDGANSGTSRGGGGGGGGVIHTNISVAAGSHSITVGAGGVVNTSNSTIPNATGGSTIGFGLTALGGGPGGCVDPSTYYTSSSLVGASGGGGSKNSNGRSYPGGSSLADAENGNMGHAGGNAYTYENGGGGGGAGSAATNGSTTGGDGYACDISGETVYYGGGGGGGRSEKAASPGKGGGKANYGGGGSGQSTSNSAPESGGPGIVIVRFTRTEQKTSADFKASGFDYKKDLDDGYAYLVITNNTTLSIMGSASLDVLLVGGGGGAGANATSEKDSCGGGGGGGGGVIYFENYVISADDYPIMVGLGGAVNTGVAATTLRGGDTSAFGFTAIGGGPGAKGDGSGPSISGLGASGGGGATDGGSKTNLCGTVLSAAYNLGNAGADATAYGSGYGLSAAYNSGGGGGAGAAANGVHGGDGYACDITGETVYYGGGGAGGQRDYSPADTPAAEAGLGGGKASWGGGGSGGYRYNRNAETGGRGIVIIRYKKPERAFIISIH